MKQIKKNYVATFTEGLLATKPNDEKVHETFIAKTEMGVMGDELSAEENTLAKLDSLEKGKTIFHRDENGTPIIWDYQVKGFLKEAWSALARDKDNACAKVKAYRKIIDKCIFVTPRQIRLELPEGAEMGACERTLRAQTQQGDRTALASSEEAPIGTKIRFTVMTIVPGIEKALAECWEYAQFMFMGAWRSGGKGTAVIEEEG